VGENLDVEFDPETLVIGAFEGWDKLLPLDFDDERWKGKKNLDEVFREVFPPKRPKPPEGYSHIELQPIAAYKAVKQDSTLLALLLLKDKVLDFLPKGQVERLATKYGSREGLLRALYRANYKEYAPITKNLSSLSPGTAAMAAFLAGEDPDKCFELAKKSLYMDYGPTDEYKTHEGIHMGPAGNNVRFFKEHSMGIQAQDSVLSISPHLPSHLKGAMTMVEYFGQVFINAIDDTITVKLIDAPLGATMPVRIKGVEVMLRQGEQITWANGSITSMELEQSLGHDERTKALGGLCMTYAA
jgi:trehalose/maltose hydrolase-like predicted phosphorylase